MARIRTIKPELWTDPDFVERSANARLLFIAGLNFASDYGVLADKPLQLKMQCFPGDSIDVAPLVDELVGCGLWLRAIAPDDAKVLLIRTFTKHQRVDKPQAGRWGNPEDWPDPPSYPTPFVERSANVPGTFAPVMEWKGMEGNGENILSSAKAGTMPKSIPFASEFDAWYRAYPRKVKRSAGLKAYQARRREGIDAEALSRACDHYAASRRGEDPTFTQHPATFLAKGGPWAEWVNGPPEAPSTRRGSEPKTVIDIEQSRLVDLITRPKYTNADGTPWAYPDEMSALGDAS